MEENHVKLSGTNEWNLILKNETDVNEFVRMVKEFLKSSLQASGACVSGSDLGVPEEEKNVSAPLSQTPPNVSTFTAPLTASVSNSVFENLTNTSLAPPGESMPSDNDVITDKNTVPEPFTDEDDYIPISPSVLSSTDCGIRNSTPTNVDSFPNAGLQQDILKSNTVTTSTDNPPSSAFVGGIAQNTGMVQNEQHSAKKVKPQLDPKQVAKCYTYMHAHVHKYTCTHASMQLFGKILKPVCIFCMAATVVQTSQCFPRCY